MIVDAARGLKLKKLFEAIIHGKTPLNRANYTQFIEAVCAQSEPVTTVQKILDSTEGLRCIQECMRFDLSIKFLNGDAARLIRYLSSKALADVGGGSYIQNVVRTIVEPPVFWSVFRTAFIEGKLEPNAQFAFAWTLLQMVSIGGDDVEAFMELAKDPSIIDHICGAVQQETRAVGQKIKYLTSDLNMNGTDLGYEGPGGRHDNDFVDFHEISILPTADELRSKELPFIRPSSMLQDQATLDGRAALHLDNQFRLLREDMLSEMREELKVASGEKKGRHRGLKIDGLKVLGIYYRQKDGKKDEMKNCPWGLSLQCIEDPWKRRVKPNLKDRRSFLDDNRNILRHQSMACLLVDGEIVAFPTIYRDEDLLVRVPPVIVVQFTDERSTKKTLVALHGAKRIQLLQIDTATFAYEPILQALQEKKKFPLESELLYWVEGAELPTPEQQASRIIQALRLNPNQNLQPLLKTSQPITLDSAQQESLTSGLTQRVSLIQGPPGTGKSFIGALLAKILHDHTSQKILVVCFTNHALDQFLEDLMDIGIPKDVMIRLGGKSTTRTADLALQKQKPITTLGRGDWRQIEVLRADATQYTRKLASAYMNYKTFDPLKQLDVILQHLEFEYSDFHDAFSVPVSADGMEIVGRQGRAVGKDYLLFKWLKKGNPGQFKNAPNREKHFSKWKSELLQELIDEFAEIARQYMQKLQQIDAIFSRRDTDMLCNKRIIGCTTTGAAKYRKAIEAARPEVLLVEEAGEILESHILTALGDWTNQLILIGDHKQLRPKVNSYLLTVEKGEGYDLNKSLFERLVLKGYPHKTLKMQHRMRPEISKFVQSLTYPDLSNAPKTLKRPDLLGVQNNVIFINHEHLEDDDNELEERRDPNVKSSKRNTHEAEMVLKIVRYLAQQGYSSENMVVLTPYLGQLRKLRDRLKEINDPVLNDMDTYDLVRAGLMTSAEAKMTKKPLRLATIDNYQGEESDIVIISLTRNNPRHDIGFMYSRERLTVLLSRARNALIMLGNADTFMKSPKGRDVWPPLFELLRKGNHLYDGFPTKCENHPQRTSLLKKPEDFEKECPDGGCTEPCAAVLQCQIHQCPSKCHQISDHSKMDCEFMMPFTCVAGHRQSYKCCRGPPNSCRKCDEETKRAEKRKQQELEHQRKLAEIEDEISRSRESEQDVTTAKERADALQQKKNDLIKLRQRQAQRALSSSSPPHLSHPSSDSGQPAVLTGNSSLLSSRNQKVAEPLPSPARADWERRKRMEGVEDDAIDSIMAMTGLEEVKRQVLRILDKVQTASRQETDVKGERLNVVMLGNPGTGKTTIARLYAKFLSSTQVIPSDTFVETTGSRLGMEGPSAAKKQLEGILSSGGGVFFIDEAYQLTGPNSIQGSQVLDFLLAEMENNIGKIVFIFAGYNKEMEKFFEHNPGLNSRVPYRLQFKDYTDEELLDMLEGLIEKKWKGRMKIEGDGIQGLYGRIAIRRLGAGRESPGFGNARALANLLARISERQSERISKERQMGISPDDFWLAKEDIIGPEPSKVMKNNEAWKKLQNMIGLVPVKETIANLFTMLQMNYERELAEKKPHLVSLNRVFIGSPGTGKTTVAKLYGKILADLGLLSNGEVVLKNPADFIGAHLGHSESQTKAILATTVGKVLVIDEAYMLHGTSGNASGSTDPFKTAVIDTIVAEVQNVPGEDRCVLLLGYKDQMEEMFQNVNPGLARRFSIENAFNFEDYSESELRQALKLKLKQHDLTATEAAMTTAMEVLCRLKNRPNFGNIGEVENLLSQAKLRYQSRQGTLPVAQRSAMAPFEPSDFDPDYNRGSNALSNLSKLFEDVIGCESIVQSLQKWQIMAKNLKDRGMDARNEVPTTFVFKGPPGTGKTTTARKMGQVFYDMGFLSSTEVIECSASDLVGEYVGHTGPKTKKLFEKALGRVLFIDEAYRLREGHFAQEAIDELVGILTQDRYRGKLLVILAGYDQEINDLLATNPGLSSRFPEELTFHSMNPLQCLQILRKKLAMKHIQVPAFENPKPEIHVQMIKVLEEMIALPSWGNARDMETLAKQMATTVYSRPLPVQAEVDSVLQLTNEEAMNCLESMRKTKVERETNLPLRSAQSQSMPQALEGLAPPKAPPPSISQFYSSVTAFPEVTNEPEIGSQTQDEVIQAMADPLHPDAGVSVAVWHQLLRNQQAQDERERQSQQELEHLEKEKAKAVEQIEKAAQLAKELYARAAEDAERAELLRQREAARLQDIKARKKRAELEEKIRQEEEKRKQEVKVQAKLRQMGVCVAGFRWIKEGTGYRCAGGSHFITNEALGI
ncbi:hypothetical protein M422DRAFT_73113 [Sphaerobolus stellatus SS14]|nr:hypothetical protein M422DRAFT_73113 [Sphaerobolus stellatus SS14]